jgi:hypothetical protein
MIDFAGRDAQHQEAKYIVGMMPKMIFALQRYGCDKTTTDEWFAIN